jgi:spore maturation protein CgeB
MRLVVFGLSLSSSWGNGHATTYRALLGALARRGHEIRFLEREQPWYGAHRDLPEPDFCTLHFYEGFDDLVAYRAMIAEADAVIVGSYVPDGIEVGHMVQDCARGVTAFYDIDTPVTLATLEAGECTFLSPDLIARYDLYLSFTGGPTLDVLMERYSSPAARAFFCSVDEQRYRPLAMPVTYDLGYLGTYSPDRQPTLERLLVEPARRAPELRFVVAGSQYPSNIEWPPNVVRLEHVPPAEHPAFYNSCRWTLNVTRADMVRAGHSPSVRLFEAAACGTPIISDIWPGIEELFVPGQEIVLAAHADDVLAALASGESERASMARAARGRVLDAHTSEHRAEELEDILRAAGSAGRRTQSKHRGALRGL